MKYVFLTLRGRKQLFKLFLFAYIYFSVPETVTLIPDTFPPQLAVERNTAGSVCLFSELVSAIERSQAKLMETMDASRVAAALQAGAMKRQLELELEELQRRESGLAELALSEDYIHCMKV